MRAAPEFIGGSPVVMYSQIDDRHRPTAACRHIVGGIQQNQFASIAICQFVEGRGFYLFYCNEDWDPITDTFHLSLSDALHQAEFEYEGISATWQRHE